MEAGIRELSGRKKPLEKIKVGAVYLPLLGNHVPGGEERPRRTMGPRPRAQGPLGSGVTASGPRQAVCR